MARYPIASVPSLKLLELTSESARSRASVADTASALVAGNPTIDQWVARGYGLHPLPHAEQEAKSVAERLRTQPLLAGAATKGAVLDRLPRARIVHLATHGLRTDLTARRAKGYEV